MFKPATGKLQTSNRSCVHEHHGKVSAATLDPHAARLVFEQVSRDRCEFVIASFGVEALRLCKQYRHFSVIAVFDRSCYVQCSAGVFCIALVSIGRGPLNLLLESNAQTLPSSIRIGMNLKLRDSCQQRSAVDGPDAEDSIAVTGQKPGCDAFVGRIQPELSRWASPVNFDKIPAGVLCPATQGFGWLLEHGCWHAGALENFGGSQSSVVSIDLGLRKQCLPALQQLYRWLRASIDHDDLNAEIHSPRASQCNLAGSESTQTLAEKPADTIIGILGAGPGLTPAGDDLLAGVMLALHSIGRDDLAGNLWNKLEPHVVQRTNVISCAHLQLAANGQCSEVLLQLISCLFYTTTAQQCDGLAAMFKDINTLSMTMGASSGWDTLAGISLVLRAYANSPPRTNGEGLVERCNSVVQSTE